jgi:hypothetical protein
VPCSRSQAEIEHATRKRRPIWSFRTKSISFILFTCREKCHILHRKLTTTLSHNVHLSASATNRLIPLDERVVRPGHPRRTCCCARFRCTRLLNGDEVSPADPNNPLFPWKSSKSHAIPLRTTQFWIHFNSNHSHQSRS